MRAIWRFLSCGLLLWICGAPLPPARAAAPPTRNELFEMLRAERFDDLEKLAGELRQKKAEFYRTTSDLGRLYENLEISEEADDNTWTRHLQSLEKWVEAKPESATARVALGKACISYAWKARGGGYANTVTEKGWRLYGERLTKAREHLEAAEKMGAKDPEVYNAMLTLALGQGWQRQEMEAAFRKGIELEPNYMPLYESKAYYLLPRWHGQPGEWEDFAQQAADARGGEEGDILYMAIARSQAWSEGAQFFRSTRISYQRMKRGFQASLKRSPENLWEMNSYCSFACFARDRQSAKQLFQKIDGRWEKDVWGREAYFQQWQNWAQSGYRAPASPNQVGAAGTAALARNLKSVLAVGGIIWLGLMAAVALAIWLLSLRSR
jgi:hypothetical protein